MEQFYDNWWFQGKWLPFYQLHSVTGVSISWQELYPIYLTAWFGLPFGPIGEFASTVTTRLPLLFCLPRAPKFPMWWTLYGWSLFKHLVLILHLLLDIGTSPRLIMSLLIVCLVSRRHCAAFSHQMQCQLPAVQSLHFFSKFNHANASCLLLLPSVLLPLLVALTHPGSTIYAILPFQQPYFLREPLFTCPGVHLKPFCHPTPSQLAFLWHHQNLSGSSKESSYWVCLSPGSPLYVTSTVYLRPCMILNLSLEFYKRSHLPTVSILHQIYLLALLIFRSIWPDWKFPFALTSYNLITSKLL